MAYHHAKLSRYREGASFLPVEGVREEDELVLASLLVSPFYVFDHSERKKNYFHSA
jgi:hypothetical protein